MPSPDDALEDGPDRATEELTVRVTVNGTTVMAAYVVEDAAVLLASADFGQASAALDGQAPEAACRTAAARTGRGGDGAQRRALHAR